LNPSRSAGTPFIHRRRWVVRDGNPEADERLAGELGVRPLTARLLAQRGFTSAEAASAFLESSLASHLRSPMLFREMPVAARRVLDAVRRKEKIAVYGDYDADGITGATQLLLFLRELGADVDVHVPHRLRDGYGMRIDALRMLAEKGTKLVVTADCGAAAHAEIEAANGLGLDVVVCDHHQAPDVRPPAFAVLNPVVQNAGFPFAGLSAAGVVFYLLVGTRMLLRESGDRGPDLRRYLDLVALGTVADLVPIVEENRVLVRHGIREIALTDRLGIRALCRVAAVDDVTVDSLGFRLAPRLNASGRLADATAAVRLLASRDPEEARRLAEELDGHNSARRDVEQVIFEEADWMIQGMPDRTRRRSFVLASEGWHPGVVGIVASRLVERYARPVVLLAIEGETARGSARSIGPVHLFQSLRRCADLLLAHGGHRMAAGLTTKASAIPALAERFERIVEEVTSEDDFRPTLSIDARLPLEEVSSSLVSELERLEPHGSGNPRPVFIDEDIAVASHRIVGERHLKLTLRRGDGKLTEAIAFRMGERASSLPPVIDLVYGIERDRWEGRERLQIIVRDFRNSADRTVS
jgi:single-stranded-DNA-specific exonuclease